MEEALVFPTTHHMLTSEALLKREGFKLRLVPAPPGAGQVCSTAIAVSSADTPRAVELLECEGVPIAAVLPYQGWQERGARRVVEEFLAPASPYPELLVSLEKVAGGERPGTEDITRLLALEDGAEKVLRVVAGELACFISNKRATGLVGISAGRDLDLSVLGELVAWMREAGHVHLLLDLGDEDGIAWAPESFKRIMKDNIIPIACADRLPRDAGKLVGEYGIRQVLVQDVKLHRLCDEEVAQEIVFLQDNRPGPVGSGNLLPLLGEDDPALDMDQRRRLETVIAICRLALIDAHLPAPPLLWRNGMPDGADMPVLNAGKRPFADAGKEAEELLKLQGWEFARGMR